MENGRWAEMLIWTGKGRDVNLYRLNSSSNDLSADGKVRKAGSVNALLGFEEKKLGAFISGNRVASIVEEQGKKAWNLVGHGWNGEAILKRPG